jgi:hypothetical protein
MSTCYRFLSLAAGLAAHEVAATVAVDWAVVFVSEAQPEGTVNTPSCVPPRSGIDQRRSQRDRR